MLCDDNLVDAPILSASSATETKKANVKRRFNRLKMKLVVILHEMYTGVVEKFGVNSQH